MKPLVVLKPGTVSAADRTRMSRAGYLVIESEWEDVKIIQPTSLATDVPISEMVSLALEAILELESAYSKNACDAASRLFIKHFARASRKALNESKESPANE